MRIGIDARLNAYRTGGIAQYTSQLLAALAPQASAHHLFTLQHYTHHTPLLAAHNVRRWPLITPPHQRFEQWSLPLEVLPLGLNVLHCPDFVAPRYRPCPAVVTIHDLAFIHYPDILDADGQRYYNQVRTSVWHADAVIAVSEATRNDISQLLGVPRSRVDLVYEAAAPYFRPVAVDTTAPRRINQHLLHAGAFALFVSTLEPRKNLPMLLRALRICRDRQPDVAYRLVVAGARGWRDTAIFETVRDLHLDEMVIFLGSVAQDDLLWLYNSCCLYLNPSLYEGFGLPVLEALACAAPAIVSTAGSLPEVAGDAALLLPPHAVEAWADAITRLWEDVAERQRLAERGPTQAARFSWERTAQETLAIYQRVAR